VVGKKSKKPNMTVTSRFFHEKSRAASRHVPNPFPNPPLGRTPIPRLHCRAATPKLTWANSDLTDWISKTLAGALFFLDTGIFTRELDPLVWVALAKKQVPIILDVARELLPWLQTPFCNRATRDSVLAALRQRCPSGREKHFPPSGFGLFAPGKEFADHGHEYYVKLLALRKMMGPLAVAVLSKRLGRSPTPEEFHAELQSHLGERGYLLAKKGLEAQNSPNKLTDERLVVTSMLTAIMTGRETVIMTRDPDVLEQYMKICTLMKEHYRATLTSELYASNPAAFSFRQVAVAGDAVVNRFSGDSILEFETDDAKFNPLPPTFHFVMIYCLLLGGSSDDMKVTVSSFCAETEMAQALRMKASTGGLTTDKFGGRNCIILTEHLTPDRQKVSVLIGEERKAQFGEFAPGADDAGNTLFSSELSMRVGFDDMLRVGG
jgi:hypothetical protein